MSEDNKELSTTENYLNDFQMMQTIAQNQQSLEDIKNLTSSKITDQLKVFLISQARNELIRVVKLTQFLDKLENNYISKVNDAMINDELTLYQYSKVIEIITNLLGRSNSIISQVLKDDSLTTILNTTIYTTGSDTQVSSVVMNLKDPQSRERARSVISSILYKTQEYVQTHDDDNVIEGDEVNNE